MNSRDQMFTGKDAFGNMYTCDNGTISLKLAKEDRVRAIGRVDLINNKEGNKITIFFKAEKEANIHRKTNAWSVPLYIYNKIDGIFICTEEKEYRVLTKGIDKTILHFLTSGTETKVYIPITQFHIKRRY